MDSHPHTARPGPAAAHVAIVTFEITNHGLVAVARNHAQLTAAGEALPDQTNEAFLSTIPSASFAGIVLNLMPWLRTGGTLHLHHGFDPAVFAAQCDLMPAAAIVLPGPALAPLDEAKLLSQAKGVLALWRGPERLVSSPHVPYQ
jgi:mycobactin salicyl-AMP ligase